MAQLWRLKKNCGAEIDFWRGGALRSGAKWGMEGRLVKVEGQRGAFWEPFGMKEGCLGGGEGLAAAVLRGSGLGEGEMGVVLCV